MSEKYTKDAENLRQQNAKQMEEQEKRLNNMAQANLQKLRSENAQQLSNLRADFTRREQQLRANSARTQQQIRAQQNEMAQLRQQINNRPRSNYACTITNFNLFNLQAFFTLVYLPIIERHKANPISGFSHM